MTRMGSPTSDEPSKSNTATSITTPTPLNSSSPSSSSPDMVISSNNSPFFASNTAQSIFFFGSLFLFMHWYSLASLPKPLKSLVALRDELNWSCSELQSISMPSLPLLQYFQSDLSLYFLDLGIILFMASLTQTRLRYAYGIPRSIHILVRSPSRLVVVSLGHVLALVVELEEFQSYGQLLSRNVTSEPLNCRIFSGVATRAKWLFWMVNKSLIALLLLRGLLLLQESATRRSVIYSKESPVIESFTNAQAIRNVEDDDADDGGMFSPLKSPSSILRSTMKSRATIDTPAKSTAKTVSFRKAVTRKNIPAFEPDSRNAMPRRTIDFDSLMEEGDEDHAGY